MASTRQEGVTLIEILIGLTIVGILIMLALPSYNTWIANARVRTATMSILNGLQLARTEAIRRNMPVFFRLTSLAGLPDWSVGCVNVLAAPPIDCPATIQSYSSSEGALNTSITVTDAAGNTGKSTYVTFNSFGRPIAPDPTGVQPIVRIDVTSTSLNPPDVRPLRVIVNPGGGQVRMCDPALPSPPTNPGGC